MKILDTVTDLPMARRGRRLGKSSRFETVQESVLATRIVKGTKQFPWVPVKFSTKAATRSFYNSLVQRRKTAEKNGNPLQFTFHQRGANLVYCQRISTGSTANTPRT